MIHALRNEKKLTHSMPLRMISTYCSYQTHGLALNEFTKMENTNKMEVEICIRTYFTIDSVDGI